MTALVTLAVTTLVKSDPRLRFWHNGSIVRFHEHCMQLMHAAYGELSVLLYDHDRKRNPL